MRRPVAATETSRAVPFGRRRRLATSSSHVSGEGVRRRATTRTIAMNVLGVGLAASVC